MTIKDKIEDLKYGKHYPKYEKLSKIWWNIKWWDYWPHNAWKNDRYRRMVVKRGYSDWVIDEMDSSFNRMMVDSLKFHTHTDEKKRCVSGLHGEQRDLALNLIERLSEKHPLVCDTEEKRAIFNAHDFFEGRKFHRGSPEMQEIFADYRKREEAYKKRINQARHDLVDILPWLWS